MFEILQELPNVTQTQGDQMLLEEQYQQTYSIQRCYKPSICKKKKKKRKKIPVKYNKVKPNKTRDAFKGRYLRKVERVVLRD